eukprot:CAMPEP_0206460604 /NCGR_PEP_ID=MMETSP0324_2-20121206/24843_1 /ASSEMBLY_ACC=CAM_ASM_000836 /TAXON_ID=2866 /ORGANISM="Crypthecodinium cohnii, Strain Seligo" /LENGTH=617 /DNA_ID=CAMNT_0053932323 /DNA_START=160 /DNA_END=2013 /DNA_ORIENTATION=-
MPPFAFTALVLASKFLSVCAEEQQQEQETEGEEEASPKDIAIAATLIGAVSFQMGLFHLTNHRDKDMRKYTYQVINQTVSIFCSVLMFSTFNDIVQAQFSGVSPEMKVLVNMGHMLVWFLILQLTLAWACGAVGSPPSDLEDVELFIQCSGTLLAHITGFASINAWGSVQQISPFKESPSLCLLVLPISFTGQFLLQRCSDWARWKVAMKDEELSIFEEKWDEETEEAENDIMGLTLSFNLIQAVRFWDTSYLPNTEGDEPMDILASHTRIQIQRLWGLAVIFALCLFTMNYYSAKVKMSGRGSRESQELPPAGGGAKDTLSEHSAAGRDGGGESPHRPGPKATRVFSFATSTGTHTHKNFAEELRERSWEITKLAWTMGFAWCCFYAGRMSLARIAELEESMTLAVALTLSISLISFSLIRILDMIADLDSTGPRVDHTIFQIIRALGLLVGFGWEQTFDQAVESISSAVAFPHLAKFVLALFCVVVIVPAWYKYILPMAITECWEWGFLVHDLEDPEERARWERVAQHLEEKRRKRLQKTGLTPKGEEDNFYVRLTGDDSSQVAQLQKENARLRQALETTVLALKDRDGVDAGKHETHKVNLAQMDTLIQTSSAV